MPRPEHIRNNRAAQRRAEIDTPHRPHDTERHHPAKVDPQLKKDREREPEDLPSLFAMWKHDLAQSIERALQLDFNSVEIRVMVPEGQDPTYATVSKMPRGTEIHAYVTEESYGLHATKRGNQSTDWMIEFHGNTDAIKPKTQSAILLLFEAAIEKLSNRLAE